MTVKNLLVDTTKYKLELFIQSPSRDTDTCRKLRFSSWVLLRASKQYSKDLESSLIGDFTVNGECSCKWV